MDEGLHIKIVQGNENKSKFDPSFGSLVLNEAGSFQVTVKEYETERKAIDDAAEKSDKRSRERWNERANLGWTKEKLQENWDANEAHKNAVKKSSSKTLTTKFKDVNWVWVVAPKQLTAAELSHNESFNKGISGSGVYNINFPKVLEGGGMTYIEAFLPKDKVKGRKPFGVFVQAKGTPKIIRVEWTDFDYNLLQNKLVSFYSEVLLHIYTEGLYGQELDIQLLDKDLFTSDDELNISGSKEFLREVNVRKVHPKEIGKPGVADGLIKSDQDKTDNKIEKEHYIQKITLEVFVDPNWKKDGGDYLEIYPIIKSQKTGTFFKNFSREALKVSEDGDFYKTAKSVTNMPVVKSEIITNVAHNHPCQYTRLYYINDKEKEIEIFTEDSGVEQSSKIEVGIIAGSDPKKFKLKVDENANTDECRYDKTVEDHELNIFTYDKNLLPKTCSIYSNLGKSIEGTAFFSFDLTDLPKYFWLSKDNKNAKSIVPIQVSTCRHQHNVELTIVPEIEWTINFFYNTPDPIWYGNSEPTYDIYGTEATAVRDNTNIGDFKDGKNRIALAELRREENVRNKNIKDGKKKIGTAADRSFGNARSNFGLSVKAVYDGGKTKELSCNFAQEYRKTLSLVKSVYDLAERIAGAKDARDASDSLPPSLAGRKSLMSLTLLPPAPSVGVSWKYAASSANSNGLELTGKVKIVPFIGGELRIDVLALAERIPAYGKLITALDLSTWLAEKISFNALSINYRIDLTFYANLALEEAFVKWSEAKPKGQRLDADLKFSGTFGGKLEISFDLKTKVNTEVQKGFSFEAGIKGDCYFKITASPNLNVDNMIDWTTKFSGLLVTGYYKFSILRKGSNNTPKTFDPVEVIAGYTGTPISMKFGVGEEKKY